MRLTKRNMRIEVYLELFYILKNVLIIISKLVLAILLIAINFLRPDQCIYPVKF